MARVVDIATRFAGYCTHKTPYKSCILPTRRPPPLAQNKMSGFPNKPEAVPDETPAPAADYRQVMNGLLTGLSHDLRTPLSTISGWLFVLDSDKLEAPAKKRALEKMRANIDDQVRLIDDVLLLSRSMTGHLVVDAKLISPLATLEKAMESVQRTANAGTVSLTPVSVGEQRTIMADTALLQRAFEILLFHALKTTPSGGVVETSIRSQDDHVEIAISDNGKGLTPIELRFLFDAFREPESMSGNAYPGVERNLMLAKMLVEKQNGHLRASSRGLGLGTTFTLFMPYISVPKSADTAAHE